MAIPFFSIDISIIELLNVIKNICFPFNRKNSETRLRYLIKKYFPKKYLILLPSARLGFFLVLKKKLKKGDEIVFSNLSFPLYIKIANELNLKVKLVDVEKKTLNINIQKLKKIISKKTKCIVVTHLFGYPCEIEEIKKIAKKKNILLIEDCAQSFGTKIKNKNTGTFGDVGIISLSLIKIPTTLGGGIIISSDKKLITSINFWLKHNIKSNLIKDFKLFIKNILSILNSYPLFYKIFISNIFFFLHKFIPSVHRKIVYSGMGVVEKKYDPFERGLLSKYQLEFGISQLKKIDKMQIVRKKYYNNFIDCLKSNKNISFLEYDKKINWNYQYLVIKIKRNYNKFIKHLYYNGIHAMEENVWDCTKYNFDFRNKNEILEVSKTNNKKLLRIPHTSFLTEKHMTQIHRAIKSYK